tara:strand:+ start:1819 stop:2841 length:1023 start_codon:yes stop_codon:yes gene_type:complete
MIKYDFCNYNLDKKNIAGFDLDLTLIKTVSGKKFPVDENDWTWMYPCVPYVLKNIPDTFAIVIFSNQLGISRGKTSADHIRKKCKQIFEKLEIPLLFVFASKDDKYRKPRIGMWKDLLKFGLKKRGSFYVGDAAGRQKDHSDVDRKFAYNCDIRFMTPEYYFNVNNDEEPWDYSGYKLDRIIPEKIPDINLNEKTVIFVKGLPVSGKSHLVNKLVDKLENIDAIKKSDIGKSIDNIKETNKNFIIEGLFYKESQIQEIIDFFQKNSQDKVKFILIKVMTDEKLSFHLNYLRFLNNEGKLIDKIVYNTYKKYNKDLNFETFDEIIEYHPSIDKNVNKYFLY